MVSINDIILPQLVYLGVCSAKLAKAGEEYVLEKQKILHPERIVLGVEPWVKYHRTLHEEMKELYDQYDPEKINPLLRKILGKQHFKEGFGDESLSYPHFNFSPI